MQLSTFSKILYACILVVVVSAASTLSAPSVFLDQILAKRQPETECSYRMSLVCYQCGITHRDQYELIYGPCCRGESDLDLAMRTYCEKRYTQPPKRGGLRGELWG